MQKNSLILALFVQQYIRTVLQPRCGPQPQLDYGLFDVRYTFLRSKLQGNIPGHIAPALAFPFLSGVDAISGPYSGFGFEG